MSQIDILNFLPHLIWFFFAWIILYGLVFSLVSPIIYESGKFRSFYFSYLYKMSLAQNKFCHFLYFSFKINFLFILQQVTSNLVKSVSIKIWKNQVWRSFLEK